MAAIAKHALIPHPAAPTKGVRTVSVRIAAEPSHLWLEFAVEHAGALLLPENPDGRQDELWQSTCFELFAGRPDSPQYVEYNFAPFAAWAAYSFERRRRGMHRAEVTAPHLGVGRIADRAHEIDRHYGFCVTVRREGLLASDDIILGLSTVIEELDGTKSYWALAHGDPAKPDFHDPACFVLTLPAADVS